MDEKVAQFLGEAQKIKEKNSKIISGQCDTEEEALKEIEEEEKQAKEKQEEENTITENETEKQEKDINNEEVPKALQDMENLDEGELPKALQKTEEQEPPKEVTEEFKEMYAKLFGKVPKTDEEIREEEEKKKMAEKVSAVDIVKDNVSMFENDEESYQLPTYKFIGIAFKTYIILEMEKELYILDQHAAHERIMYEKVKKNYYSEDKKDSQMLLLPDVITLTHKEMDIAKENMAMFKKAGFELEEFGDNTIKLTGCPAICLDLDTKELFLETLDEINTVARTAKQEKEEKFIATVACKAAVKAHMALDEKEVHALLDTLLRLPNPFTCPHGRPTAIKMTQYDIERKFSRK